MDAYVAQWEQLAALKQRIDSFDDPGLTGISARRSLRWITSERSFASAADKAAATIVIQENDMLRLQFNQTRAQLVNRWGSHEIIQGTNIEANEVYHVRVCNYFRFISMTHGYIEDLMIDCNVSEATIDAPKTNYRGMRFELQGANIIYYEVVVGENVPDAAMEYRNDEEDMF